MVNNDFRVTMYLNSLKKGRVEMEGKYLEDMNAVVTSSLDTTVNVFDLDKSQSVRVLGEVGDQLAHHGPDRRDVDASGVKLQYALRGGLDLVLDSGAPLDVDDLTTALRQTSTGAMHGPGFLYKIPAVVAENPNACTNAAPR